MMREFEISEEWKLISAEVQRMSFINTGTNQLYIITPVSISGYVDEIHDDISCLTFDLDERCNLKMMREIEAPIGYDEDKMLSWGEIYDLLNSQSERIKELESELYELKNEEVEL